MLLELPILWTIIINVLMWLIIHLSLAYIITIMPIGYINFFSWIYSKRNWENNGKIYEQLFRIKSWKGILPDGAAMFEKGFRKKKLNSSDEDYLQLFLLEINRAEFVHWLVIFLSPLFAIWNPLWATIIMVIYAIIANLPCILAQRYNRIRFQRILNLKKK